MSNECTNDCSSCGQNCSERKTSFIEKQNALSRVKKVIGVVSGKGGVGKSLVTTMLAVNTLRRGQKTAILDADITGPSIPKALGIKAKADALDEKTLLPVESKMGIKVMSVNLLLEDDEKPVVWRGPILAGTVKQFWTDVAWGDVDFMYVDMPPGTGDVPLTVFQSLPVDGIIVVTTPQELVSMIVKKAVNMAQMMHIPVIGIVENMSYFKCPDCGKNFEIFGKSKLEEIASAFGIKNIARLPINPELSSQSDKGLIELYEGEWLDKMSNEIEKV